MNRSHDIKTKLAYTLTKYKEVQAEINIAEDQDTDVPFLGQKAGEIISGCRECLDYCAKDIADNYIIALSDNSSLISKYNQGKNDRPEDVSEKRLTTKLKRFITGGGGKD